MNTIDLIIKHLSTIDEQLHDIRKLLKAQIGSSAEIATLLKVPKPTALLVQNIIRDVATLCGFTPALLCGVIRSQLLVDARWIAIGVLHEYTALPSAAIGSAFNRDHGTVLHACNRLRQLFASDPIFAAKYQRVAREIARRHKLQIVRTISRPVPCEIAA